MARRKVTGPRGLAEVWQELGSRDVWNSSLAKTAIAFVAVTSFAFSVVRLHSFSWLWVVVETATFFEFSVMAIIILGALPSDCWKNARTGRITNIALVAILGVQENILGGNWAEGIGLNPAASNVQINIVGGIVVGIAILVVSVSISASIRAHRLTMVELLESNARLLEIRSGAGERISTVQDELIRQTQVTLIPKLEQIRVLLAESTDAAAILQRLLKLIESDVRPLSQALHHSVAGPSLESRVVEVKGILGVNFPAYFSIRESLKPKLLLGILLPIQATSIYLYFGADQFFYGLACLLITVFSVELLRILLPRNRRLSQKIGILIVAIVAAIAIVPQWLMLVYVVAPHWSPEGVATLLLLTWACIIWQALVTAVHSDQTEAEANVSLANTRIARELSLFNQALWLQSRRWGYLLHGNVQATLTVTIARLAQVRDEPVKNAAWKKSSAEVFALVSHELQQIIDVISDPPADTIDLEWQLERLQRTWAGVLNITLNLDDRVRATLADRLNLKMAINEITREAATNAFRHGGADAMTITMKQTTDDELILVMSNNGSSPKGNRAGMGSEMLDALSLSWKFKRVRGAEPTVLQLNLAVSTGTTIS